MPSSNFTRSWNIGRAERLAADIRIYIRNQGPEKIRKGEAGEFLLALVKKGTTLKLISDVPHKILAELEGGIDAELKAVVRREPPRGAELISTVEHARRRAALGSVKRRGMIFA